MQTSREHAHVGCWTAILYFFLQTITKCSIEFKKRTSAWLRSHLRPVQKDGRPHIKRRMPPKSAKFPGRDCVLVCGFDDYGHVKLFQLYFIVDFNLLRNIS